MSRLEEVIKTLKAYIGESVEAALEYLEQILEHDSQRYNDFIQIKSRYKSLQRELLLGVLDHSTYDISRNNISKALLLLSEDITENDLRPEGGGSKHDEDKRGEILYNVPELMQVGQEHKCAVRIAFDIEHIKRDWEESKGDVIKSIRVSETMAVSLLNLDENDPPFAIRSFSETVQFVDKDDFTEWLFYVKPLKAGNFPLLLKVSVIEMINNKEYKKDIVLEEKIVVVTEEVPPAEAEFKSAGTSIALSESPLPLDAPVSTASSVQKAGRSVAGALIKVAAMAAVITAVAVVGFQVYEQKQDDKAWGMAKGKRTREAINQYQLEHPDGRHVEEARILLDSLNALSNDTLSLPNTTLPQGSETTSGTTGNVSSSETGASQGQSSSAQPSTTGQKDNKGKKGSAAPLPPSPNPNPSAPTGTTQPSLPAAPPSEILRGQHFFFGIDKFTIVDGDAQFMDFKFFQFNQYREVLAILGSIGNITMKPGMSIALIPEKGEAITAQLKYVATTPELKNRYDGYFAISSNDLERLANEKFKRIRLIDTNGQSLRTFSLTSAGMKDLKHNAGKAIKMLDERN